jgi:hypothetical protein
VLETLKRGPADERYLTLGSISSSLLHTGWNESGKVSNMIHAIYAER